MKRVGIFTYHHYYNYGTMLQALSLQCAIERLGYSSELFDYSPYPKVKKVDLIKIRFKRAFVYIREMKRYITLLQSKNQILLREETFEEFYNSFVKKSKKYDSYEDVLNNPPVYDAYIVGSDQTWNPMASNRPDIFYLPFIEDGEKKGSYAPSISLSSLTEEQECYLKEHLSDFSYLSCREFTGAKLLEKILSRNVTAVLDPTLLLEENDLAMYEKPIAIEEPYLLMYFLGDNIEHRYTAKKIAEKLGLKIVALPMAWLEMRDSEVTKIWGNPGEFLSLIKNASFVCTDSFHGTAYSVNYNVNFCSFYKMKSVDRKSENSRINDFLSLLDLEDRIISTMEEVDSMSVGIDYEKVNCLLSMQRKKSWDYLSAMLKNITNN